MAGSRKGFFRDPALLLVCAAFFLFIEIEPVKVVFIHAVDHVLVQADPVLLNQFARTGVFAEYPLES